LNLQNKIQEDIKVSMKAKDGTRVSVLRFLLAAIKNREIELRDSLDDEQVLQEIVTSAKRRRESIEAFREADRKDLVIKEESELVILEEYLPEQLSSDEVRKIVQEVVLSVGASSPAAMGQVMKEVMPRVRGRADGKMVNQIVIEILSG
jgi:hypothetical protein